MARTPLYLIMMAFAALLFTFGCKGGAIPFGDQATEEAAVEVTDAAGSASDVGLIEQKLEEQICQPSETPADEPCPSCMRALPADADLVLSIAPQRLLESEIVKALLDGDVDAFIRKLQAKYALPFVDPLRQIQHVCLACKLREPVAVGAAAKVDAAQVPASFAAAPKKRGLLSRCAEFAIVIEGELPAGFDLKQAIEEKSGATPEEIEGKPGIFVVGGTEERRVVVTLVGGKLVVGTLASVEAAAAAIVADLDQCPMKELFVQVPDADFKAAGDLVLFSRIFRDRLSSDRGDPLAAIFSYNASAARMVASAQVSDRLLLAAKVFSREKSELISEVLLRLNSSEMAQGILADWLMEQQQEIVMSDEVKQLSQTEQQQTISVSDEAKQLSQTEQQQAISVSDEAKQLKQTEQQQAISVSDEAKQLQQQYQQVPMRSLPVGQQ